MPHGRESSCLQPIHIFFFALHADCPPAAQAGIFNQQEEFMNTQKADNLLNLAYDASLSERNRSPILNGALTTDGRWEIIAKGTRSLQFLSELDPQIFVTQLLQNYAILTLPKDRIPFVASLEDVIFLELPKRLFSSVSQGTLVSCIRQAWLAPLSLSGQGVLVGIIDSGLDTAHPDFVSEDGASRILFFWDQGVENGSPPDGYTIGTEYTQLQINAALRLGQSVVPDSSGHGTAVAGIAAGNGAASGGMFRGAAWQASLIAVNMRPPSENSFPRTSELMMGINYCVEKAIALQMPLALNISFGNNYGSHTGTSLAETFLNQAAALGRTSVFVGCGNEGISPIHTSGMISSRIEMVEFSIGSREPALDLQLWKNYADEFTIRIIAPDQTAVTLAPVREPQRLRLPGVSLIVYYGMPQPYHFLQEIFLDMIPDASYLPSGIWKLELTPVSIRSGRYDLWLPGGGILQTSTRFLAPVPYNTLTIPSTASQAVSVGAYDSTDRQPADFSGRGPDAWTISTCKPDLLAPGVDIIAPAPGGGYQTVTGTSFASPLAAGSAALLMEWGIVRKNDPYLYGEKLKAVLARSARQFPGFSSPNPQTGYGALCLYDALRNLERV